MHIVVRPFTADDAPAARNLFIRVNKLLAPPHLTEAFESYIVSSLREEIDKIPDYYGAKGGAFWVAVMGTQIVGMFGLESVPTADAMELRRMYVDPSARRRGVARTMLQFAEEECRRRNVLQLDLSTSELQNEALSLYRNAGYQLAREEVVVDASNKTVGGGIRRFYFTKRL
jgi:GNAT superfamily N-acetyltransferase